MPEAKHLNALHSALNQAEYALARLGDDLQFLIKPEGGLAAVRRGRDDRPTEPGEIVAELAGTDPLMWRAERPEGPLTLGLPYREPAPRCALSGRFLPRGLAVDLYYRGRPVGAGEAYALSPRLTFVHGLVTSTAALLFELWKRMPKLAERGVDPAEGSGSGPRVALWSELVARIREILHDQACAAREPAPKASDVPEEN